MGRLAHLLPACGTTLVNRSVAYIARVDDEPDGRRAGRYERPNHGPPPGRSGACDLKPLARPSQPAGRFGVVSEPVESASAPLIEAKALTKRFGDLVAVDGIDFTVDRGEVFGFLGPNGAGKTTAMRMIACVSPITDGDLRVLGMNPVTDGPAIRARLGVVPQEDNLDTELTVWDNLVIYGRYFGLPMAQIRERATELLHFARLDDRRTSRVDPLSGGMKRRLIIARSLINRPELVLLDEPTTGLDPQARHLLWERLYRLKREGVTLVLTTHYMDEAEQLCDRLVIMDGGRIVAGGSPRQLIDRYCTREVVELRFELPEQQDEALAPLAALGERVEPLGDRVLLYTSHGDEALARVTGDGIRPESVLVRRASLEDVFLTLTGRTLDE
jgi:lipooligosaccharide transport system ATP-binding protein